MEKITITKSYPLEFLVNTAMIILQDGNSTKLENETDVEFVGRYMATIVANEERRLANKYKDFAVEGMKNQIEAQIAPLVNQMPEVIIE